MKEYIEDEETTVWMEDEIDRTKTRFFSQILEF